MIEIINSEGQVAFLEKDAAITIERNNPLVSASETFWEDVTYSFEMPANYAKQGGNSFGVPMVIGTKDLNSVKIVRNNFEAVDISTTATFNLPILTSVTGYMDSGFINTVQSSTLTANVNTNYPSYSGTLATVPIIGSTAPTPTGSGTKGQVIITGGYRYERTATDTWVRSSIETTW